MSRLKLWVGLIVLFGAGMLAGIVGTCLYHEQERAHRGERGPAAQHERIMKRLTSELALTSTQETEIELIVSRAHVEVLELRFAHQSEVEQILTTHIVELKAKLSPDQQRKLDGMYSRLQQHWQKSREYLDGTKKRLAWLPYVRWG